MGSSAENWSTQQLAEFLAVVTSYPDEESATRGAVERAAEALEAEVAAIVKGGGVVASIGFPEGELPAAELVAVTRGELEQLEVPGRRALRGGVRAARGGVERVAACLRARGERVRLRGAHTSCAAWAGS